MFLTEAEILDISICWITVTGLSWSVENGL